MNGFICEVQVHLGAVLSHKEESHLYYEFFRTYFAGNLDATRDLIELLEELIDPNMVVEVLLDGFMKSEDKKKLFKLYKFFYDLGDPFLAGMLCERLRELNPESLAYLNNLAICLYSQGKYDEAEPMYRECLKLKTAKLGKDHPSTLISKKNLDIFLRKKKEREEKVDEKVHIERIT